MRIDIIITRYMPCFFKQDDLFPIKNLHLSNGYNAGKWMQEIPDKGWKNRSPYSRLKSSDTGTTRQGEAAKCPYWTVDKLDQLVLKSSLGISRRSAEPCVKSHVRLASVGHQSSVVRIVRRDRRLKCFKMRRSTRIWRNQKLWKLIVKYRQSYCNNNQQLTSFWPAGIQHEY